VSALTLLGMLGNILSTVAILPHLRQSLAERRPVGSASGWALGALCGVVWLSYGWLSGDLLIGAPGWVTAPVSLALTLWCWKSQRTDAAPSETLAALHLDRGLHEQVAPTLPLPVVTVPAPRGPVVLPESAGLVGV
jgi:hypothetical protein